MYINQKDVHIQKVYIHNVYVTYEHIIIYQYIFIYGIVVTFRMVVFRPFVGETLCGKIVSCNENHIRGNVLCIIICIIAV